MRSLRFTRKVNLRRTMLFERECFHPNLRMTISEKREVLRDAVVFWMHDNRSLIGETYGVPISVALDEDDDEEGHADLVRYRHRRAIYVFSTAIRPRRQGKGLSKILKTYFPGRAAQAGYRIAIGHAKEGRSSALNQLFGARLLTRHRNWYGTGETYWFYEMPL